MNSLSYDEIEYCFSFLPIFDLSKCTSVCNEWRSLSQRIFNSNPGALLFLRKIRDWAIILLSNLDITENQKKFIEERMYALFEKDMNPEERMISVFPRIHNFAKIMARACMYNKQKENCIFENVDFDLAEEYKRNTGRNNLLRSGGFYASNNLWYHDKTSNDPMQLIRKLILEEKSLLDSYKEIQNLLNELESIPPKELFARYKLHFDDFMKRFKSLKNGVIPELSKEEKCGLEMLKQFCNYVMITGYNSIPTRKIRVSSIQSKHSRDAIAMLLGSQDCTIKSLYLETDCGEELCDALSKNRSIEMVQFVGIWHSTAFQKVLNALSNSNVKEIMAPPFVLLEKLNNSSPFQSVFTNTQPQNLLTKTPSGTESKKKDVQYTLPKSLRSFCNESKGAFGISQNNGNLSDMTTMLISNPQLEKLVLQNYNVTNNLAKFIATTKSLKELSISLLSVTYEIRSSLINSLSENTSIEKLSISGFSGTKQFYNEFFQALEKMPSLRNLELVFFNPSLSLGYVCVPMCKYLAERGDLLESLSINFHYYGTQMKYTYNRMAVIAALISALCASKEDIEKGKMTVTLPSVKEAEHRPNENPSVFKPGISTFNPSQTFNNTANLSRPGSSTFIPQHSTPSFSSGGFGNNSNLQPIFGTLSKLQTFSQPAPQVVYQQSQTTPKFTQIPSTKSQTFSFAPSSQKSFSQSSFGFTTQAKNAFGNSSNQKHQSSTFSFGKPTSTPSSAGFQGQIANSSISDVKEDIFIDEKLEIPISEKTGKLKCLKLDCQDYASLSPLFSFINSNLKLKHLIIPAIPANPATERTTEIHDRNELKYWKELCDFIAKDYALEILTLSSSNSKYSDHLAFTQLAIALQKNTHLKKLHLEFSLSVEQIIAALLFLQNNKHLKSIHIKDEKEDSGYQTLSSGSPAHKLTSNPFLKNQYLVEQITNTKAWPESPNFEDLLRFKSGGEIQPFGLVTPVIRSEAEEIQNLYNELKERLKAGNFSINRN